MLFRELPHGVVVRVRVWFTYSQKAGWRYMACPPGQTPCSSCSSAGCDDTQDQSGDKRNDLLTHWRHHTRISFWPIPALVTFPHQWRFREYVSIYTGLTYNEKWISNVLWLHKTISIFLRHIFLKSKEGGSIIFYVFYWKQKWWGKNFCSQNKITNKHNWAHTDLGSLIQCQFSSINNRSLLHMTRSIYYSILAIRSDSHADVRYISLF